MPILCNITYFILKETTGIRLTDQTDKVLPDKIEVNSSFEGRDGAQLEETLFPSKLLIIAEEILN